MKKRLSVFFIVIIAILILIFGGYVFLKSVTQSSLSCAEAGHVSSNPSLGPDFEPKNCCEGLVEISRGLRYKPDNEYADEKGCIMLVGAGLICSDCGNGICEEWENQCNCPEDCV